jgi:hypothetical protein
MKRLVLFRLDDMDRKLDSAADDRATMRDDVADIKKEIAVVKAKGGFWGAVSGGAVVFAELVRRNFFGQ